MNVIELNGLSKSFHERVAVQDLTLNVEGGEVFGLLGRNGAGKSTAIKMMLGLIAPTNGDVRLMGHDLYQMHNRALEHVGALVERPSFYEYLSGRRNLQLLARNFEQDFDRRSNELADRLGILNRLEDKVSTYSQGMRQKLGIVLSLLPDSRLVVLDEPTNGLDPQGIREVRQFISEFAGRGDVTVFLSSHLLSEVEQICTSLAVIEMGKVLVNGPLNELLKREPEVELQVGALPRAVEIIKAFNGCSVSAISDDRLRVNLKSTSAADLNKQLVDSGIEVSELRPVKRTLEEYFLHLTGEESGS
ncbi:MAG: ABC transporter ATP-binding protein [Planctomycetota bacterium]|jgi:ABC-2 type transport system ATP-binding protein|nr:ABC transporter ATP-binding protein [Planctomycetota bacterium]